MNDNDHNVTMKVCVITCDAYDHLMTGFAYLFNKFWGEVEVEVRCFRQPPPLPANFKIWISPQPDDKEKWTDNLRLFFGRQPDHYVWLYDDYWMNAPIDHAKVDRMEDLMIVHGLGKSDLSNNTNYFAHTQSQLADDLVEATGDASYRWSTQPSIWSRAYHLHCLIPNRDPWTYELLPVEGADKYKVVGIRGQIYGYSNVYYKGKADPYMLAKLNDDDLETLQAMGALNGFDPRVDINEIKKLPRKKFGE